MSEYTGIIFGQSITSAKLEAARRLRRDMTPAEIKLWDLLRRKRGGFTFRRQQIIDGFIADFFCEPKKLVIELDGEYHENPIQKIADKERSEHFAGKGLKVLRFKNSDVLKHSKRVLEIIDKA